MTETVRVQPLHPQRNGYGTDFATFERAAAGPPWLRTLRRRGFERFAQVGFPSVHEEEWKYTDVSSIAARPYHLAPPGRVPRDEIEGLVPTPGPRLVFVNGRFAPDLSDTKALPKGVELASLAATLERDAAGLEPHLGRTAAIESNPFVALNTGFLADGAFVRVAPKTVLREPLHLIFIAAGGPDPTANHPRTLILAGESSEFTIVETYAGLGEGATFTNAVTELVAGPAAQVDHYKLQLEGEGAHHIATLEIREDRDARVTDHAYDLGGRLVRNDVNVRFAAPGAEATLNGLFVLSGEQHVDNHTRIDHAVPHCTSREFYKGILDGHSRGVFYGKVFIRKDAQKSNAAQTNKNLILSEGALVDSTPALEINADDVKASHGSTIGQLDRDALFYLRSRGIGADTAKSLLTYAFARDVVDRVRHEGLKAHLDALLLSRLPHGPKVREVLHEAQA
jgi:Fe-S cluster assembly protein SufD